MVLESWCFLYDFVCFFLMFFVLVTSICIILVFLVFSCYIMKVFSLIFLYFEIHMSTFPCSRLLVICVFISCTYLSSYLLFVCKSVLSDLNFVCLLDSELLTVFVLLSGFLCLIWTDSWIWPLPAAPPVKFAFHNMHIDLYSSLPLWSAFGSKPHSPMIPGTLCI